MGCHHNAVWISALLGMSTVFAAAMGQEQRTVTVHTPEELRKEVQGAKAGTTIRIAKGTYRGGFSFRDVKGEEGRPIVLVAEDPKNPPVISAGGSALHFSDPAYLELRNLILEDVRGNGINIDDGGSLETPAHHVVLHGLTVRGVAPDGNRDGIKLSGLDHFRVENCTVEKWGNGGSGIDMVGCHEGQIVDCTFRHRSDVGANGVQTKGGSSAIVIQRCRFESSGGRAVNIGGSTGEAFFRPANPSYEAKDITVEDCTFLNCGAPICFVGVDGAVVRYNTIYRPIRYVIQILQESRDPKFVPSRKGVFTNNLIVFRSDEIRGGVNAGPGTEPSSFVYDKNYWYCIDRPASSNRLSLPAGESFAGSVFGVDPMFKDADKGDVTLQASSPVRDAGVRARPAEK